MHRKHASRMAATLIVQAATVAAILAGCAGSNDERELPLRTVGLGEFAAHNNQSHAPEDRSSDAAQTVISGEDATAESDMPDADASMARRDNPPRISEVAEIAELDRSPRTDDGGIELVAEGRRRQSSGDVIVDSLVGQVNGRPIFADRFFEPIEDQLIAISQRSTSREFIQHANDVVTAYLREIVLNELFLAEAESQLTSDEQRGLFAFMRMMRDDVIAAGGGARAAADRRLREQDGITVEEYIEARRDMLLLRELQRRKIQPRVIISWRDVEREYLRRYDQYNPSATVNLARIRLSTQSEAEQIEQVETRLAAGESFADIAESLGLPDGGEWQSFTMGADGLEEIALSEQLRRHLIGLDVGQTTEAFEVGGSTWWLHVAEIDQPDGRSLYDHDVQRELMRSLQNRRFTEEMNKYIERLMQHGVYDELEEMRERLLVIAVRRYGP